MSWSFTLKYYTEKTLAWMMNNKTIVFLGLLSFCLFVSTLALAGQKNSAQEELAALKESIAANTHTPETSITTTPDTNGDTTPTIAQTPAETMATTPAETMAQTPAETVAQTPAETVAQTPAETVAETPAETMASTTAKTETDGKLEDTPIEPPSTPQKENGGGEGGEDGGGARVNKGNLISK